jgi:hypothetical protein
VKLTRYSKSETFGTAATAYPKIGVDLLCNDHAMNITIPANRFLSHPMLPGKLPDCMVGRSRTFQFDDDQTHHLNPLLALRALQ